jgi:small subunit ribosomal protein S12
MTLNQLIKKPRRARFYKIKCLALASCPQKKGRCCRVTVITPRKPNSALRKVSWLQLSNHFNVWGYIPGFGHKLQQHSTVLIRGGRVKDLPGMKYTIIRGKLDLTPWSLRMTARSKYGAMKKDTGRYFNYFNYRVY